MAMRYIPIFILLFLSSSCKSDDQLTHTKPLTLGDTLISNGGGFALGFFSPSSSNTSLYLGIWYHNIPGPITIVWVANRDNPILAPSSPVLAITNSSDLVLSDSQGRTPWAVKKNSTGAGATAVLLDEGNLVLRLPNGKITWQSFDHPTDTVLPKMRFLVSYKAKVAMRLVAWKGPDDPSSGDFSCSGDPSSPDLQFVTWNKTEPYCRLTVRSGKSVSGGTYLTNTSSVLYQTSVNSGDEFYVTYTISDNSTLMRLMIDYTGKLKYLSWNRHTSSWAIFGEHPYVPCELYASCGPFSYCDFTQITPACQCLDGFEPDDGVNFFSKGCYRQEALKCGKQSHFAPLSGMKVPDNFFHIRNRSLDECAAECSRNCSCTAYAYSDLSSAGAMADPSRCLVWSGELIDAGKSTSGENMYIRLANSPGKWRKKKNQKKLMLGYFSTSKELEGNSTVPSVTFEDILSATNFFADSNLLGRGGFGKVYKGTFEGENVVAVKRLSQNSGQGTVEFRNEVVLIAKLQHKNLVRLLGCCIHGDEKLLIYEYLPNKSLDSYLFDFGMARIFGANQNQANTNRVVGTYGYMSPEYAMRGAFSVKSDTYSFGVLLLEIVSGLKISSPQLIANFSSLITYAWRLWEDEKATELVDCSVVASCPLHEVLRCIHVGLLCVQDHPNDRPLMSSVMNMIENENALLPTPKQPIYFAESNYEGAEARESMENSVNEMSITTLEGR
ncbi:G-type lectin S-receptor-like serine/threonine-protein kinase B120 isoform X7 [Lolium rigidum]|uniref:G-type lectin S-receptor-like serine/threonine-protein kinase B120 isoform X7 n=1 Tax=Lolium rigidum TaxID=89674 RepID=UPI001F5D9A28|nr:G-type lectin S-receptor-like serine/threonine-protein kinase B120 isoform X7 [Lolium rigidum]